MRFLPKDMKNVLPLLFNMDHGNNENWLTMHEVDGYIDRMKRCLKDVEFDAFQQIKPFVIYIDLSMIVK